MITYCEWILIDFVPNLSANDIVQSLQLPSLDHVGLNVILDLLLDDILDSFIFLNKLRVLLKILITKHLRNLLLLIALVMSWPVIVLLYFLN